MHDGFDYILEQRLAISESPHDLAPITIVEGCARGADSMAERLATMVYGIDLEHHPANWDALGKPAGPIRNTEMLASGIDLCLAFHKDLKRSKGTLDMVEKCLRAGIEVRLYPRS